MNQPVGNAEQYVVVHNAGGRTSCWPVGRTVPNGWSATEITGTREHCLEAIRRGTLSDSDRTGGGQGLRMSLMFFGDTEADPHGEKYRLLLESARMADRNQFEAIWLPERHFNRFGCLYPSPSLLHAALAMNTTRLRLRAGSVVLPLNDPLRVAEQWSVVDNLSGGRVEVAFASGWHPDDFVLAPEAYDDRAQRMLDGIETVRALWRGESIPRRNGAGQQIQVRTYPTPIQQTLPIWLTAAGSPETFRRAGQLGFDVLTHLFHQDIAELDKKIRLYRAARRQAGHLDSHGRVAVTLHTFVAPTFDEVRQRAGEAYCQYLRSNLGLLKQLAFSQGQSMDIESLPTEELDQMLHWLLEKFIGGRSLMGTVDSCVKTCAELAGIGVSEVACLLDFGPEIDDVLSNLRFLTQVHARASKLTVA